MEEFSKDPFWYLKVRYINWVHLVYKYYQWLWKFAWYQSFSKKIKPPFFKVLSYFINQTQFKKLFFKIVDLWVIYFKWLSHIRKDLGNFGFAFLWALLLTLCLI